MSLLAKKTGGGSNLGPLAPGGVHQAVCVDVIDLGEVTQEFEGKKRQLHMVQFVWQLDKREPQSNKRYLAGKRYNLSLNEKATLRKDLESWRTKPFTREEELGFDVLKVIGGNCMVNIQHVTKATGTYANVITINPLYPGMTKLTAENYTRPAAPSEDTDAPDDAVDNDPFNPHAASAAPVGAAVAPALVTDDDIPF